MVSLGFNPRAHVGRDTLIGCCEPEGGVSIHAPTWGATSSETCLICHMMCFNPRAHVGRDPNRFNDFKHFESFNPRAHVGRDVKRLVGYGFYNSFNPRAHVGRDKIEFKIFFYLAVSIHAPTWGATWPITLASALAFVSIHAPTWGATDVLRPDYIQIEFQSTRPRGARLPQQAIRWRPSRFQSTRPRGARLGSSAVGEGRQRFNPRAHVGRDMGMTLAELRKQFQSTRPRGARPCAALDGLLSIHVSIHAPTWGATTLAASLDLSVEFQSTRPRGARHADADWSYIDVWVSIHAPTWGATAFDSASFFSRVVSIHAPTWGATERGGLQLAGCTVSIHAPTWGATSAGSSSAPASVFQSTRPRGARPTRCSRARRSSSFNPRAHVGRDSLYRVHVGRPEVSIHAPTWGATFVPSQ